MPRYCAHELIRFVTPLMQTAAAEATPIIRFTERIEIPSPPDAAVRVEIEQRGRKETNGVTWYTVCLIIHLDIYYLNST